MVILLFGHFPFFPGREKLSVKITSPSEVGQREAIVVGSEALSGEASGATLMDRPEAVASEAAESPGVLPVVATGVGATVRVVATEVATGVPPGVVVGVTMVVTRSVGKYLSAAHFIPNFLE